MLYLYTLMTHEIWRMYYFLKTVWRVWWKIINFTLDRFVFSWFSSQKACRDVVLFVRFTGFLCNISGKHKSVEVHWKCKTQHLNVNTGDDNEIRSYEAKSEIGTHRPAGRKRGKRRFFYAILGVIINFFKGTIPQSFFFWKQYLRSWK